MGEYVGEWIWGYRDKIIFVFFGFIVFFFREKIYKVVRIYSWIRGIVGKMGLGLGIKRDFDMIE